MSYVSWLVSTTDHLCLCRNAYFFGLPYLSKTIVLYDTLLDQNSPAEVEAVMAHELGHWQYNHTLSMMFLGQSVMWANLSLIRLTIFNPRLVRLLLCFPGHILTLAHSIKHLASPTSSLCSLACFYPVACSRPSILCSPLSSTLSRGDLSFKPTSLHTSYRTTSIRMLFR